MKVAHLEAEPKIDGSIRELLEEGRRLESEKEFEKATKFYNAVIRRDEKNESAYTRLMIMFRKLKEYAEESRIIDEAINAFEGDDITSKREQAGKIEKLSLSLGKLTGLIDKKGNSLYDPEPIATWKKRKLMVQKRLKSQKKKEIKTTKPKAPILKKQSSGIAPLKNATSRTSTGVRKSAMVVSKRKSLVKKTSKTKKK